MRNTQFCKRLGTHQGRTLPRGAERKATRGRVWRKSHVQSDDASTSAYTPHAAFQGCSSTFWIPRRENYRNYSGKLTGGWLTWWLLGNPVGCVLFLVKAAWKKLCGWFVWAWTTHFSDLGASDLDPIKARHENKLGSSNPGKTLLPPAREHF